MCSFMNSSNLRSHNDKVDSPKGAIVSAWAFPPLFLNLEEIQNINVYRLKKCSCVVGEKCVSEESTFYNELLLLSMVTQEAKSGVIP